jgi:hypothetical protein
MHDEGEGSEEYLDGAHAQALRVRNQTRPQGRSEGRRPQTLALDFRAFAGAAERSFRIFSA